MPGDEHPRMGVGLFELRHSPGPRPHVGVSQEPLAGAQLFEQAPAEEHLLGGNVGDDIVLRVPLA